jgi:hypothetical protein
MPWSSAISPSSAPERGGRGRAALRLVVVGVAIAVGAYAGLHLFLPLAATALAWWVGARPFGGARRAVVPAAAVQAGHLLWLAFGQVVTGALDAGVIDLAILTVGVVWLVSRPGLAPTLLLTLYQAWALVTNGAAFAAAAPGTLAHRALLVHVLWRLLALVLMWRAYGASRRADAHPPGPRRSA